MLLQYEQLHAFKMFPNHPREWAVGQQSKNTVFQKNHLIARRQAMQDFLVSQGLKNKVQHD